VAVAVLVLAVSTPRAAASTVAPLVYVSPASHSTFVSTTFTLDLLADCGANADAVALTLSFDPRLLQVQSVTPDLSAFAQTLRRTIDNSGGRVYYDAGAPLGCHAAGNCPSGGVRVAQVTLRTLAAAGSPTPVGLSGKLVWSGSYIFNGAGTGSAVTIRLRGDVDLDCEVDVADMMLVAQVWGTRSGDPGFVPAYDADANGQLDILDIMNVAIYWGEVCLVP
jgi:hypothetical protein